MTDKEIVNGLSQNDRNTIAYIYKTLAPATFKYVLNNSGTREDAKDLFQDVFIKTLNNVQTGKYDHREKFEAYFFRIARNTWIDDIRKRKNNHSVDDDDFLLQLADESDEDALVKMIVHDKRLDALSVVWDSWDDTECHRRLKAFHYDGVKTKDIADTEGVKQGTLLKQLFDCRKKLFRLVSRELKN
jgi:RNA polymerase sigma factor (sigma-70 family)